MCDEYECEKCQRCDSDETTNGTCPYDEDVNGTITECNCCDSCREECAQEI